MTDTHSRIWNDWNAGGGPGYPHNKVVQYCLRNVPGPDRAGTAALDLGCGTGINSWFLAREGFQVSATDISEAGVAATRARLAQDGLVVEARVESADTISFPDDSFDLVVSVGVLEAVGPRIAAGIVAEARRVLKPGGRFLFVFAAAGDFREGAGTQFNLHGFTRPEVEQAFAPFEDALFDQYITTYGGDSSRQVDWLITN